MPNFSVIIAAAGRSTRFGESKTKKPFVSLVGKPVWLHSVELFSGRDDVSQIIMVVSPEDIDWVSSRFESELAGHGVTLVTGGAERAESVANGLQVVNSEVEFVAIHDAARPLIDAELIDRVFSSAIANGAAIAAIPVYSTVKYSPDGNTIENTVDRNGLYLAQTPQFFRRAQLLDAIAKSHDGTITDEAQLAELHGIEVSMVTGSVQNIKITTPDDLTFAEACLLARKMDQKKKQKTL